MIEKSPRSTDLSPEGLRMHAERFHAQLAHAADVIRHEGEAAQTSETTVYLGTQENFVHITQLSADSIRIVVGKTPVASSETHRHISFSHLLRRTTHEETSDGKNPDPNAFDAWEATVTKGGKPKLVYAAHSWETGVVKDADGKEKKEKKVSSPSKGIQVNNTQAVTGIEELLAFNTVVQPKSST